MKQPKFSIVIPAYQEAARIERSLDQLAAYLRRHRYDDTEVLVVVADNPKGSDGTGDLARAKAGLFNDLRVVETGLKLGKGHQVRIGMLEARGEQRLFMDADLATPLHYIQNVRQLMDDGAEVVIAVRNLSGSHTGLRRMVSSLGNWLVRAVLLPGISDTQCGFKAFSAATSQELFRRQTIVGWGFDMEILAIAKQRGYKLAKVFVPDWSDQPHGSFESGAITSAAAQTFGELATILWRRWTGGYRKQHFTYELPPQPGAPADASKPAADKKEKRS